MRELMKEFHFGALIASHVPVRGKPFQAEFEEIHSRNYPTQRVRVSGILYRDSLGRTRQDCVSEPDAEDPGRITKVTFVYDAVAQACYIFDSDSKTAKKLEVNSIKQRVVGPEQPSPEPPQFCQATVSPSSVAQSESLGVRSIEGLMCEGHLERGPSEDEITEVWISWELQQTLLQVKRDPEGEIVYRLFNIRFIEPEANLFASQSQVQ